MTRLSRWLVLALVACDPEVAAPAPPTPGEPPTVAAPAPAVSSPDPPAVDQPGVASPPVVSTTAGPRLYPPTTIASLSGITGDAAGNLHAVGTGGTILRSRDRGATWEQARSGTARNLSAVWAAPGGSIHVAGDDGVLLRSADGGETWRPGDGSGDRALAHLAGNATEIYAAGEAGTLLRSTDLGAHWQTVTMPAVPKPDERELSRCHRCRDRPPPEPTEDDELRRLYNPTQDIQGLAAPVPGQILLLLRGVLWDSSDGGKSWQVVVRIREPRDSFAHLWADAAHFCVTGRNPYGTPERFFVACGVNRGAPYVSRWRDLRTRLISPPIVAAAPQPGGAPPYVYLVGDSYPVHWSYDGGDTWNGSEQSAAMQSPYALAKRALWVAPDGVLFAAGSNGAVMRSADRAQTWELRNGNRESLFGGAVGRDGATIYAAVSHAVLRGRDGAWGLRSIPSKLPIGDGKQAAVPRGLVRCCTDVHVARDGAVIAAGSGLLWRSSDDGLSWRRAYDDDPRWDCCWSLWGDDTAIHGVDRDVLLTSRDDGKTWKRSSLARLITSADEGRFAISGAGDHLFVVGGKGVILHSPDRGRTWRRRDSGTHEYLYDAFAWRTAGGALGVHVVGEHGVLLRSRDGEIWERVALDHDAALYAVYGDASRGVLLVAGATGVVFQSVDDGQTWTRGKLVEGMVRDIFGDGHGRIFAIGDASLVVQLAG